MDIFCGTFYFCAGYGKNILKPPKKQLKNIQFRCMWISHGMTGIAVKTEKKK